MSTRCANCSGNPQLAIIDCRFDLKDPAAGRRAYLAGHIPRARYADLDRDLAAPQGPGTGRHPLPAPDAFAAWAGAAGIGDGTQVVAYDAADGSLRGAAVVAAALAGAPRGGRSGRRFRRRGSPAAARSRKAPVAAAALRFMPTARAALGPEHRRTRSGAAHSRPPCWWMRAARSALPERWNPSIPSPATYPAP